MIDPFIGQALADILAELTSSMAGQSLADAYNQHMTGSYNVGDDIAIGLGNYTSSTPAISGDTDDSISSSTETDPVDAWHDYVENDGSASEITGGALSGSTVNTCNYSLLEDTNGDIKAVAPVSVPLDHAYVAIAQALGVSIKVSEINPILGNKMESALVSAGVVYDKAKGLVSAWWDGVNMLFPKKAVDAINDVLNEEHIGPKSADIAEWESYIVPFVPYLSLHAESYPGSRVGDIWDFSGNGYVWQNTQNGLGVVNNVPFTVTITITNKNSGDTSTTEYESVSIGSGYYSSTVNLPTPSWGFWNCVLPGPASSANVTRLIAAETIFEGVITPGSSFPDGTSQSQAPSYTPSSIPSAGGIASSASTTENVVPINLPVDPLDTTDSTVDPISSTDDDTVSDLPAPPIPTPIPDTNPSNPDVPLVDPSVVNSTLIEELVEELANTLDPQAPQSSGLIPVPLLPGGSSYPSIVPASGSGLIHVYNPTPAEMVAFGNWLWVTYADASIDKIWNNPFDGIIGAHELYSTPQTDGSDNIRSGFLVCPTTAALVRQRYTEIDCGSIIVPEFYGNYLDYSPYSQAYVYLPFIGINELSIDDVVGHAINIRYRVDAYNGSCIAMIYVAKDGYRNLCYQFAGNCAVEVPLAGGSQAAIKAGMMQSEAYARAAQMSAVGHLFGGIGSVLMGSLGGVISGIGGIASDYANAKAGVEAARVANKSSVQHSGSFGASHGAMGMKIPFIIIRNPIQVKVVNYNDDYGFPAHKRVIIGGCSGYLRVREVNVVSAYATDDEKAAIEVLLKNGVYVS